MASPLHYRPTGSTAYDCPGLKKAKKSEACAKVASPAGPGISSAWSGQEAAGCCGQEGADLKGERR
ncbi:MAG: hypothetical protein RL564_589 [Pseudomonadota bacterium]|jgi:hypothetical protein